MSISKELFTAILAMDSYNRGYGQRLDIVAAGASSSQIGNATLGLNSNRRGVIMRSDYYNNFTPSTPPLISSDQHAFATTGELFWASGNS